MDQLGNRQQEKDIYQAAPAKSGCFPAALPLDGYVKKW